MSNQVKHEPGFYLHMQQDGEGCDYMIGCGHKLMRLDARDIDAAKTAAMNQWRDHGADGEAGIGAAHILVVNAVESLAPLMVADRLERIKQEEESARARKRETIARLKKELGEP